MENMKDIYTTDTDLKDYFNFNLLDYIFIPKGFKIYIDICYKQNGNFISTPWTKIYSNYDGKITAEMTDVEFDDPYFENFSEKEKIDFLKYHYEIMDFMFYRSYFDHDHDHEFIQKNTEKISKYLSNQFPEIYIAYTSYALLKNDKSIHCSPYSFILKNPKYDDINPIILKYLDIPKGVKLTLKFQYHNGNGYNDVLPWKKTYSNPDGNRIMMEYHDVDFDNPFFENFSDEDICFFFNYYMTMLDHYFFDSYDYQTCIDAERKLFDLYLRQIFLNESIKIKSDLTFNGVNFNNVFKRKGHPDICYSCSKRKIKNNECIYLGFI